MKSTLAFLVSLFLYFASTAQTSVEVTPELQKKFRLEIEKEIPKKQQQLEKDKVNAAQIEFILDTFRVERFMEEYIKVNFSDYSMRDAGYETAKLYDSLLNKYYKKLLATLKGEDKKVLIQAQKTWIAFRDSESKLVDLISKDTYSGGGTMQQLTESAEYLNLIKVRTIAIFNHYIRATQNY
jgi:uncharacterized protein YecT (DUF1311 family)